MGGLHGSTTLHEAIYPPNTILLLHTEGSRSVKYYFEKAPITEAIQFFLFFTCNSA